MKLLHWKCVLKFALLFYLKFSTLWLLRLWALEVRYLLINTKPHRKRWDNSLGTLLITSSTLRFHKLSPHCFIQITLNIQRTFEDSDFTSFSRDPVSRINKEKLDVDLRSSYNNLCICLEHTKKSALILFTPHRRYRHFTVVLYNAHKSDINIRTFLGDLSPCCMRDSC